MLAIVTYYVLLIFTITHGAENVHHKFILKKDFLSGIKSNEFSVYDDKSQQVKYRIESRLLPRHNNEIIAYPSKKVIAKLKGQWSLVTYSGDISIFDQNSNTWINGNITDTGGLSAYEYVIYWNGDYISMDNRASSTHIKFYDRSERNYVARFRKQNTSWKSTTYSLEVLSEKYPDALYLLGLIVWDHDYSRFGRG